MVKKDYGTMENVWDEVSKAKRKKLLKASGLHPSFAEVPKFKDLPSRSGGHVKRDLEKLFAEGKRRGRF